MPDQLTSEPTESSHSRRSLLRGGAVAAAAAGVAVVAASVPTAAYAADGESVELGAENASSSATTVTIGGSAGSEDPTLALNNATGPSLYLQPLDYESAPELALGQIANTELGPVIGVDAPDGPATTFVATGIDLADLPTPVALEVPVRILDTRSAASRAQVIRSSTTPTANVFDAQGRLKAGSWIDVDIAGEEVEVEVPAVFVNVTVPTPSANGFVAAYPPGDRPNTSTVNFQGGVTIANQTFVSTRIALGRFAVRFYTNATTHLVLDLNGVTIRGGSAGGTAQSTAKGAKASATSRLRSTMAARLVRALRAR